ncbi:UNVERIFIED_ORG: agmatinase [Rhizobium nepotum]|nr:agmatinase [Rhizobium nepotum]
MLKILAGWALTPSSKRRAQWLAIARPICPSISIASIRPSRRALGRQKSGGPTSRQALDILHGLKGVDFVGGDVVEVAPQYDTTTNTAHIGAQMLFEILSLIRFSPAIASGK